MSHLSRLDGVLRNPFYSRRLLAQNRRNEGHRDNQQEEESSVVVYRLNLTTHLPPLDRATLDPFRHSVVGFLRIFELEGGDGERERESQQ